MIKTENIPQCSSSKNIKIKLHLDSRHSYFGEPYGSQGAFNLMDETKHTEYSEELFYINTSFRNISIMKRNGLAISIPYTPTSNSNQFTIRKIMKMRGKSLDSIVTYLQSLSVMDDSELVEIKAAISHADPKICSSVSIMIDYNITSEELKSRGNTLYHYQTDTVISFNDILTIDAHPYSTQFLNIGTFGITNTFDTQKEFNLKLRYVNHDHNPQPLYINLANKVFTLFPQKDAPARRIKVKIAGKMVEKVKTDYIQLFYPAKACSDEIDNEGVNLITMSLDEAKEKLGIYPTYSGALNSGDVEGIRREKILTLNHDIELMKQKSIYEKLESDKINDERKQALADKEHSLELLKRENTEVKQKYDTVVLENKITQTKLEQQVTELENEKKRLSLITSEQDNRISRDNREFEERLRIVRDTQDHRLKQESMHWKDFYENRANNRKDTSDFARFIPGLILAVAGITATYAKLSASKEN